MSEEIPRTADTCDCGKSEAESKTIIVPGSGAAPYGNFHSYYKFNPVQERLPHFPQELVAWVYKTKCDEGLVGQAGGVTDVTFLDIGCNEGDLSSEFANLLIRQAQHLTPIQSKPLNNSQSEQDVHVKDIDHEPTAEHASAAGDSSRASSYDVLHELGKPRRRSEEIEEAPKRDGIMINRVVGICVDLDSLLITRACRRHSVSAPDRHLDGDRPMKELHFIHGNITETATQYDVLSKLCASGAKAESAEQPARFDIVLLLSVTMWIHIHHGDEGLRRLLKWVSEHTRCIVVELHGWRSYQTLTKRWKRAGQPLPEPLKTLTWRQDVDDRILEFLQNECGFVLQRRLAETHWSRKLVWLTSSHQL